MTAADKRRAAESNGKPSETVKVKVAEPALEEGSDLKILARDPKGNPLLSRLDWSEKALERVLRVPSGFMRDRTQRRIEELAEERSLAKIDLELVEEGIKIGLQMMEQMINSYGGAAPKLDAEGNPVDAAPKAEGEEAAAEECPVDHKEASAEDEATSHASASGGYVNGNNGAADDRPALNEVSVLSEMERRRDEARGTGVSAADQGTPSSP